jgi:hypothetical protein
MNELDLSIKIDNEEDLILRIKIDDSRADEGIIIFDMYDTKEGKRFFKFKFEKDQLLVLENPDNIPIDTIDLKEKFEELLVQSNPKQTFGTEETENADEHEDAPYDPEKIRVDTKQLSLRQVYDMMELEDIDLTPDFQRNLVWDDLRKSRLIESILLRIPLPIFYFAQDEDGKISVVDGLQRLSTIRDFMNNNFRLNNLEYLQDKCGGKYYSSRNKDKSENGKPAIDAKYFRWLNMTNITVNVIDPSSPFKLKYDIFRRINTGGQPLNAQEIRNCLASRPLRSALREMANLPIFKSATGWSVKDVRMESQELALRFILFHRKYQVDKNLSNYSGNIDSELNTITEQLSKDKYADYREYVALFENAMLNAYHLFGEFAFRKSQLKDLEPGARRQLINKALFVSWSVLLSRFDHTEVYTKNVEYKLALPLATRITNDEEFFQKLTWGTNAKLNHQVAFKAAEEIITENLTYDESFEN